MFFLSKLNFRWKQDLLSHSMGQMLTGPSLEGPDRHGNILLELSLQIFNLIDLVHRLKKCKDIINWLKAACIKSTDGAKVFNFCKSQTFQILDVTFDHIVRSVSFVASFATTSANN